MGISYGGFVAIELARQFQERLHTLTLSGSSCSHEELFEKYEAISLRFYRGGPERFDLYTDYMYEKIFGEAFVRRSRRRRSSRCGSASTSATATTSTAWSGSPRRRKSTSASSTADCRSTAR